MKTSQILVIGIVIILVGIGAFFAARKMNQADAKNRPRQAVFLTNGQVYFGYVSRQTSKTVVLKDIYYLQVQQPLQPPKDANEQQQPQISLVKLGKELHGPKDEMRINREHILFIEDMNDDSKVNQAIAEFMKNGGTTATPTPQS